MADPILYIHSPDDGHWVVCFHCGAMATDPTMNICIHVFVRRTATLFMQYLSPSRGWELHRDTDRPVLFATVSPAPSIRFETQEPFDIYLMRRRRTRGIPDSLAPIHVAKLPPLAPSQSPLRGPAVMPTCLLVPSPPPSSSPLANPSKSVPKPTTSHHSLLTPLQPAPSLTRMPAAAPNYLPASAPTS